jgi:tripeptidyl-peptidase-1
MQGPNGLARGERVNNKAIVPFRIALKQNNLEHGYDYLMNVSHPASQHYGKLWTSEDIQRSFAPSSDSVDAVLDWLLASDIRHIDLKKGWLHFETSVASIESLIHCEYYEHVDQDGAIRIACDESVPAVSMHCVITLTVRRYHLPERISKHIDYIVPGVALSAPLEKRSIRSKHSAKRSASGARSPRYKLFAGTELMTPDKLRALYGIPDAAEVANSYTSDPANTVGVFEFIDVYNQTDLNSFYNKWAPNVPKGTHPILDSSVSTAHLKNYSTQPISTSVESNIDLDILYSLVYPQTVTYAEHSFPVS